MSISIYVVLIWGAVSIVLASTESPCPNGCKKCITHRYCDECEKGHYMLGGTCRNCSKNCRSCSSETTCEKCKNGYYIRVHHSDFYTPCRPCSFGCKECTTKENCTQCKDGYYNSDGQCNVCPTNCLNDSCNKHNGMCDHRCIPGYWGTFCNESCPKNCLKGTCHVKYGMCALGCRVGYYGKMCDCPKYCICTQIPGNCTKCFNDILYAELCDKECSNTCIDQRCDLLTGRCTSGCVRGYFGDACSKKCSSNCPELQCNRETGKCNFGEDEMDTDPGPFSLEFANIFVFILLPIVAVLGIYACVTTAVLIKNRKKRRHQLEVTMKIRETVDNSYQPVAHRNAADSGHMYAVPDATSRGILPLVNIRTTRSNNSGGDRNTYIQPVCSETTVKHEYVEVY